MKSVDRLSGSKTIILNNHSPLLKRLWDECPAFEKRAAAGDENLTGRGRRYGVIMICDVCGRSMTTKDGTTLIGVSISLGYEGNSKWKRKVKKIYPEIDLNKSYNICYVCWLKSLGIKLDEWKWIEV